MSIGTEVGDAYIAVHANTNPARKSISKMAGQNTKEFKEMDAELQKLNDTLELKDSSKGRARLRQLQDALGDVEVEGRKLTSGSKKWISPELRKKASNLTREVGLLKRSVRDVFTGADLTDPDIQRRLDELFLRVDTVAGSMGELRKEGERSLTKYNKDVILAKQRTLSMKNGVADLKATLGEARKIASKTGDVDLLARIDSQLHGLTQTMRDNDKALVGLTAGEKDYNTQIVNVNRSLSTRHINAKKILTEAKEGEARLAEETRRLATEAKQVEEEFKKYGKRLDETDHKHHLMLRGMRGLANFAKTGFTRPFQKLGNRISTTWQRMDSTVRAVLTAILVAAQPLAAIISGLSSSLVGLAAAAAGAALALAPLAGLFPVLALSALGFASVFPKLKDSWTKFMNTIKANALAGMLEEVQAPFEDLLGSITDLLTADVFKKLGAGLAEISRTLQEVFTSSDMKGAMEAFTGPLLDAFTTIINALAGPLLVAFLNFVEATAPIAEKLADMFIAWAGGVRDFFQEANKSGKLETFFESLLPTLQAVLDLFGTTKDVLATLFKAGVGPGTDFLNLLVGLLKQWNDWMNTIEGQDALAVWFDRIGQVMPPLFDLIGALGKALGDLVTPAVIEDISGLLGSLSDVVPVLGQILSVLGAAHIVQAISKAIQLLGAVLAPMAPILVQVATAISDKLISSMVSLLPTAIELGKAVGDIILAIAPLIPIVLDAGVALIKALLPAISGLAPFVTSLVKAFTPLVTLLLGGIGPALDNIMPVFLALLDAIVPLVQVLLDSLVPVFIQLQTALGPLVTSLATLLVPVIQLLTPLMVMLLELAVGPLQLAMSVLEPVITLVANALASLVDFITPAVTAFAGFVQAFVDAHPFVQGIQDRFQALASFFSTTFGPSLSLIVSVVKLMINVALIPWKILISDLIIIFGGLWSVVSSVITSISNLIRPFTDMLASRFQLLISVISYFRNEIANTFSNANASLRNFQATAQGVVDKVSGFFKNLPSKIVSFFSGLASAITSPFRAAFNNIKDLWNATIGKIHFNVPSWVPGIGGKGFSFPKMAMGGITAGPTIAGEAGREAVIPLDRALNRVDPSVRWLASIAQGKGDTTTTTTTGGVTIAAGAIQVNTPMSNPELVAQSVLDRIVANSR